MRVVALQISEGPALAWPWGGSRPSVLEEQPTGRGQRGGREVTGARLWWALRATVGTSAFSLCDMGAPECCTQKMTWSDLQWTELRVWAGTPGWRLSWESRWEVMVAWYHQGGSKLGRFWIYLEGSANRAWGIRKRELNCPQAVCRNWKGKVATNHSFIHPTNSDMSTYCGAGSWITDSLRTCVFSFHSPVVFPPWVWPELSPHKPSKKHSPQGIWGHGWRAGHLCLERGAAGLGGGLCERVLPTCPCLWQHPGRGPAVRRADLRHAVWWLHEGCEITAVLLLLASPLWVPPSLNPFLFSLERHKQNLRFCSLY